MITVYDYTADNNPSESRRIVAGFGIKPHPNPRILARQLAECVNRYGDEAAEMIKDIHPDADLFECNCKDQKSIQVHSNIDGQAIKNEISSIRDKVADKSELLIVGGIVVVALALILKK